MNFLRRAASAVRNRAVSIGNRVRNRVTGRTNARLPSPNMVGGGH